MGDKERTIYQANKVVTDYVTDRATEALGRVQMEIHGEGCGCRNCVWAAATVANSWVEFISKGDPDLVDDHSFPTEVVNGKLKIKPSKSWERSGRV